MLGAIAGDVIGSVYEWLPIRSKHFALWSDASRATGDSILTIAVADCLLHDKPFVPTFHQYLERGNHHGSLEALFQAISSDLDRFVGGAPYADDLTVLMVRRV